MDSHLNTEPHPPVASNAPAPVQSQSQGQDWMPNDRLKVVPQPTDVNVWHIVTEADFLYVATVNCLVGEAFAKGLVEAWNASLESRK